MSGIFSIASHGMRALVSIGRGHFYPPTANQHLKIQGGMLAVKNEAFCIKMNTLRSDSVNVSADSWNQRSFMRAILSACGRICAHSPNLFDR
jgi:hypothetical protein